MIHTQNLASDMVTRWALPPTPSWRLIVRMQPPIQGIIGYGTAHAISGLCLQAGVCKPAEGYLIATVVHNWTPQMRAAAVPDVPVP